MCKVGDIVRKRWKDGRNRPYIYIECPNCKKVRLVHFNDKNMNKNRFCNGCSLDRTHEIVRGTNHGMWRGGRTFNGKYWQVKMEKDDPFYSMGDECGYVLEHRLFMARHIGRPLESWEIVHHIDGNKKNNNIVNLELIPNSTVHLSYTRLQMELAEQQREIIKWQKLTIFLLQETMKSLKKTRH